MRVSVAEMRGRSSSVAALLAMTVVMMAMLITQTHCFSINQTITVSYSAGCDGLNDDLSCLVGQTDLDSDEFMLDSEFSRRILAQIDFSGGTSDNSHSLACNRGNPPKPCHPTGGNSQPLPQHCTPAGTNRDCYHYG
ncbi:hypothetical protein M0R45_025032 [Rubus argutus]|uniref:Uncharacterized protein n=1 Tax=Rubus argutus TaxID=59490 RepID=A0AAW1WVX6_RUBAR